PLFIFSPGDVYLDQTQMRTLGVHSIVRKPISMKLLRRELIALSGHEAAPELPSERKRQDLTKFAHLRVLVAEDNPVNRMVIKGLLGKLSIVPVFAENGVGAAPLAQHPPNRFSLLLMDCEMPEMDGFEATRSIRDYEQREGLTPIPIVALTAHALQEHRQAVFDSGMN